jgi:SNF2 family DNA or RNA helicase
MGQKKPVEIFYLVGNDSIEELIRMRTPRKIEIADVFAPALVDFCTSAFGGKHVD